MVGVYYSSFSPDVDPFVTVGSKIKKGDTLCIIEAMKLMNEIHAEYDGEIMDVCVENGDVVEFSQVLFKIQ
jgi:acetyl-CoA carboxylase biotin carboxyl carrier protein